MHKDIGRTSSLSPRETIAFRTIATAVSAMLIIRTITTMEALTRLYGRLRFKWMRVALISFFRMISPVSISGASASAAGVVEVVAMVGGVASAAADTGDCLDFTGVSTRSHMFVS